MRSATFWSLSLKGGGAGGQSHETLLLSGQSAASIAFAELMKIHQKAAVLAHRSCGEGVWGGGLYGTPPDPAGLFSAQRTRGTVASLDRGRRSGSGNGRCSSTAERWVSNFSPFHKNAFWP